MFCEFLFFSTANVCYSVLVVFSVVSQHSSICWCFLKFQCIWTLRVTIQEWKHRKHCHKVKQLKLSTALGASHAAFWAFLYFVFFMGNSNIAPFPIQAHFSTSQHSSAHALLVFLTCCIGSTQLILLCKNYFQCILRILKLLPLEWTFYC